MPYWYVTVAKKNAELFTGKDWIVIYSLLMKLQHAKPDASIFFITADNNLLTEEEQVTKARVVA